MTLGDLIAAYVEQVEVNHSYRINLNQITRRIGTVMIRNLAAIHVNEYVGNRLAEDIAGSTMALELACLSAVLKWARHVKNIDLNPDRAKQARCGLPARKIDVTSHERTRIPTQDKLNRLYARFEKRRAGSILIAALVRFAASSAMRFG